MEPGENPTVGVEEEYQLVDVESGGLRPRAERVLGVARPDLGEQVQSELNLSQVEIGTPVCSTLAEVRAAIVDSRRRLAAAAASAGSRIVALGTHPSAEWLGQAISPGERYRRLEEAFQQLAREQLICGCHVHVACEDPDLAVRVTTDVRPWLAPLLALSANSPFWEGVDTGYSSFRSAVFARWPNTGTPPRLESRRQFDALVERLVRAGGIEDASFLYWDVRPSTRYPTVEIRIADVCSSADDAVLVAALSRSLVRTHARRLASGETPDDTPVEVHRVARWRASRFGLDGELVDPTEGRLRPAPEVVESVLAHLRDDLEAFGEWEEVESAARAILGRGNGAMRQRQVFARNGSLLDVVRAAAAETLGEAIDA